MNSILIGRGHVGHARAVQAKNHFKYPAFFFLLKCSSEQIFQNALKTGYRGVFSLSSKDYLDGKSVDFQSGIQNFLKQNCHFEVDEVWLHTMPRMLGYVFNPVSFWLCKKNGNLEAVLVEVNNTFGERHFYWIHPPEGMDSKKWFRADKVFHVSPFFSTDGYYRFNFNLSDRHARIDINYYGNDDKLRLATWIEGDLSDLFEHNLTSIIWRYGWITLLVPLRIHWQALRLWLKKVRFYPKPEKPVDKVTTLNNL